MMSSETTTSSPTPPPSSSSSADAATLLSRRLRIDEIKERRRRFHKETAERWILEQQFGENSTNNVSGPDSPPSSTTTTTTKSDNHQFSDLENAVVISRTKRATTTNSTITGTENPTDNAKSFVVGGESLSNNNSASNSSSSSAATPTKPLTDRNSFLNAFEFFSRGATTPTTGPSSAEESGATELLPASGDHHHTNSSVDPTLSSTPPQPKPRSSRGSVPNVVSERTGSFSEKISGSGGSPATVTSLARSGSAGSSSSVIPSVRNTLLKFQESCKTNDNNGAVDNNCGSSSSSSPSSGGGKRLRSNLRLEWTSQQRSADSLESKSPSPPPPLPPSSSSSSLVRSKIGMFLLNNDDEHHNKVSDQQKPQRSSSPPSSSLPLFLHSPPPNLQQSSCSAPTTPEEEDNSATTTSPSSSCGGNNPPSNCTPPEEEEELLLPSTQSSSSSLDNNRIIPEGRVVDHHQHNNHAKKRPSIPDILVLDPIVIITEDSAASASSSSSPPTNNPPASNSTQTQQTTSSVTTRRRPSSILKKRDSSTSAADEVSGFASSVVTTSTTTTSTSVSFACDDDDDGRSRGDATTKTEPYRRRSRSYSGSSSGGAQGGYSRRRNSAEAAHYYNYNNSESSEDFPHHHHHHHSSHHHHHRQGILKHSCSSLSVDDGSSSTNSATHSDSEFKSILKQPALRRSSLGSNIHTVHQTRFSDDYYEFIDGGGGGDYSSTTSPTPPQHRSILKRKSSTSSSQPDVSTTSSLRSTASSYCSSRESLQEPDPKPILKKKSSSEEISDSDYNSTSITPPPPRPILKNKQQHTTPSISSESIPILVCSTDLTSGGTGSSGSGVGSSHHHPIKPCLKKPCKSFDESALWGSSSASPNNGLESTSSIIRKSSPHICSVKRCEEDSNKSEDDDDDGGDNEERHVTPNKSVFFTRRRDSEPLTPSPTMEDSSGITATRRGSASSETFTFKRKIELGKIDFSNVYERSSSPPLLQQTETHQHSCSSSETSPSSGIDSSGNNPLTTTMLSSSPKKTSSNAITQRIAALQISGESSWKKRVSRQNPEDEIVANECGPERQPQQQQQQQQDAKMRGQNGILANRLSMLESSQETWRKRVSEKDAKDFTVQGKLERAGKKVINDSPEDTTTTSSTSNTKKKSSTSSSFKNVFRGMRGSKTDESIVKSGSGNGGGSGGGGNCVMIAYSVKDQDDSYSSAKNAAFQRSKSMRYARVSVGPTSSSQENTSTRGNNAQEKQQSASQNHVTVPVIKNDNETFTRFFESDKSELLGGGGGGGAPAGNRDIPVIVEDESFNSIIRGEETRQLLGNKRNIKVNRNKERNVRNPVKALAERTAGQQCYVDVNPEIRERDNIRRRIQMENSTSATHAHLSIEALAGLASKEDFTSVKLRRAQQEISAQYPYPLLIRIKGKRFVQTRLAAPEVSSINSGDNFILITQTKLYHFVGEYSNRMERSKSLDVVAHVVQKKEFGCSLHTTVITLQEESKVGGSSSQWDSFFDVLGTTNQKDRKIRDDPELLGDEADENYEGKVISRNKVWRVITGDELDQKLLPLRDHWGTVPKHSLLEATEVLIFDFGPEMYVWSGSKAPVDKKRLGYRLAQELFDMEAMGKEFDDVKGSSQQQRENNGSVRRPSWCWLRKVNQHMEPILFIEKFFDWPEEVGRIRVGKNTNQGKNKTGEADLSFSNFMPCDPAAICQNYAEEAATLSLVLEGFDVKRGRIVVDQLERRHYTITTTRVQTWAISEFSKSEVPDSHLGQFNSTSTYVIRWQYSILFVGKDLKGNQSKHNASTVGGRDRCAYFFWHGKRSKITEQGASALMTVELDDMEERRDSDKVGSSSGPSSLGTSSRGPQIRVEQNYEPPAFLSLFKGKMFIHDPQANSEEPPRKNSAKLFVTLGTDEEEAHFMEVACSVNSFRNNGCFLLFDLGNRVVFVWRGSAASSELKQFAVTGANSTVKNPSWSPSVSKVVVVTQSQEPDAFWSCLLGGSKKFSSSSLSRWKALLPAASQVPEMFRFTSINGRFEAIPVTSPRRGVSVSEAFPLVQEDLYGTSVSQPSIFLVLSPDLVLYLWQGWRRVIKREMFVPEDEDSSQHDAIPLTTIWPRYRRCSVETALAFASFKNARASFLVYAGVEPDEFAQVFPYWDTHLPAVKEAHDYHVAEGKGEHERVPLMSVLEEITAKKTYSVEELMEKPEGVDLSRLEDYVSDDDFERLFSMPRTQFAQLQAWRKTELKKSVGLF